MKKDKALAIAHEAAREAIELATIQNREYGDMTFSTLEIHFADGSDVPTLSIPYQRFANRASISIPYRLVKVEET